MDTAQQRNIKRMLDISRIVDNTQKSLALLGPSQTKLKNRLAMAFMGAHSQPQLISLRQSLRRQARALEELAGEMAAAADLAGEMEEN